MLRAQAYDQAESIINECMRCDREFGCAQTFHFRAKRMTTLLRQIVLQGNDGCSPRSGVYMRPRCGGLGTRACTPCIRQCASADSGMHGTGISASTVPCVRFADSKVCAVITSEARNYRLNTYIHTRYMASTRCVKDGSQQTVSGCAIAISLVAAVMRQGAVGKRHKGRSANALVAQGACALKGHHNTPAARQIGCHRAYLACQEASCHQAKNEPPSLHHTSTFY